MKKVNLTVILIVVVNILFSQTCFELKEDNSGLDRSGYPANLNEKACLIANDFPNNDFKVFEFGFPLIASQATGEIEKLMSIARRKIDNQPYYLMIVKVLSTTKVIKEFKVETRLPETGIYNCLTHSLRELVNFRIKSAIDSYYVNSGSLTTNVGFAIEKGIDELENIIMSLNAGNCCLSESNSNHALLLSKGFHFIKGGITESVPTARPNDNGNIENRSSTLDDYTSFDIGLIGKLQAEIDNIESKGHTCHGYLTADENFCDNKFDAAEQDFISSQTDFNIWYHVWVDSESGEYKLYEKIDEYEDYLTETILSNEQYLSNECGKQLAGEYLPTDCSELCHGTKRAGRCSPTWFPGVFEHFIIELDWVCYLNLTNNAVAEYMIPNSGKNGGAGYVDLADVGTGELFEIKSKIGAASGAGTVEVEKYVAMANLFCSNTSIWKKGTFYPSKRVFPNGLVAELYAPGVIQYRYDGDEDVDKKPGSIDLPVIADIKKFMEKLRKGNYDAKVIELKVAEFLHEHEKVAFALKSAAVGVGIAIMVATIIEDVISLGGGIVDDPASFYIAFRLIRIAI